MSSSLFQNIGMLCMQELFFVGWVDYLKHCKWSTFLKKERRVLTRKRTKMSNYLTHSYLTACRASRNRFSAISLHDYLRYCGKFLAHFLMKIDHNIISSLQYSLLTLRASWLVWCLYRFYRRNKIRWRE